MSFETIAFNDFRPDLSAYARDGVTLASGVIPWKGNWREIRQPLEEFQVAANFDGGGQPVAETFFQFDDTFMGGSYYSIFNAALEREIRHSWDPGQSANVSQALNYPGSNQAFRFSRFGQWVIATAFDEDIQVRTASAGLFGNLIPAGTMPKAAFSCHCANRLIIGYIEEGGNDYLSRVWWSKRNDPTVMTVGATSADPGFKDLYDDRDYVTGLVGFDDSFLVFRNLGVERWTFIGGDTVWFRKEIGGGKNDGMKWGDQVVKKGRDCYYRSHAGWKSVQGLETILPIDLGLGSFFNELRSPWGLSEVNAGVRGALGARSGLVLFTWYGRQTNPGAPELVGGVYNPEDDRWSVLDLSDWYTFNQAVCSLYGRVGGLGPAFPTEKFNDFLMIFGQAGSGNADYNHYTFSANATMDIEMRARRWRGEQPGRWQLSRVRPVYNFANDYDPIGLDPGAPAEPEIRVVIARSRHPLFKGTRITTLDNSEQDGDGFFQGTLAGPPLPLGGGYFQISVQVPSYALASLPLESIRLTELRGLELEVSSRGRGR